MTDFWKQILTSILSLAIKIIEKLLDTDIDKDGKNGF